MLLGTVLWWLAGHDGGRHLQESLPLAWVAAAFLPWAPSEFRRIPRTGVVLIAALMLGAMVSIVFGTVRAGFEPAAVTFATTVVTGLSAHRVWRRDWGPAAMLLLLVVGFGLYWQRSFMQWWGGAGSAGTQWLALSWHNQSGTLMAAFGLLFLGLALVGRRLLVPAGVLLSAGGFAGLWLSGSRGALAAALVGLGVVAVIGVGKAGLGRAVAIAGATIALTIVVVGWLTFVRADVAGTAGGVTSTSSPADPLRQPLLERDQDAGSNALRRFQHMQAALGMFADRPLTGHGLGSYGSIAIRWSSPDANLTTYAHNRYAQTLGEGGLVTGVPLLGLLAAAGILSWRRVRIPEGGRRGPSHGSTMAEWRPALTAGMVGGATMIAVHSMIDFDWTFPVLPILLAVTLGALTVDHRHESSPSGNRVSGIVATAAIGLLLVTGAAAHALQVTGPLDVGAPPGKQAEAFRPWQPDRGSAIALALSERGAHQRARTTIDRVAAWSPGRSSIATERAVIAYRAGTATAKDVASTLEVGRDWFGSFNLAASELIEGGDHHVARRILQSAIEAYPRYDLWDRGENEAQSYALLIAAFGATGECDQAQSVVDDAPGLESIDLEGVLIKVCGQVAQ